MERAEVIILANMLMHEHGLIERGWYLNFDNAIRRNGCCDFSTKTISISKHYVRLNTPELIKDTLLHEIAHALAGEDVGHGDKWKSICKEIGAIPVAVKRNMGIQRMLGKWRATCSSCGKQYDKARRPNKNATYYCAVCPEGKSFLKQYALEFIEHID